MAVDDNAAPGGYEAIEADIEKMEDFAKRLSAGVRDGYNPMLSDVARRMRTVVPPGDSRFPELRIFLEAHHEAQLQSYTNATNFRVGTDRAANAAQTISDMYRESDAFADARVTDVRNAFKAPEAAATDSTPASVTDTDAEVF
jgi:hypothetical protein